MQNGFEYKKEERFRLPANFLLAVPILVSAAFVDTFIQYYIEPIIFGWGTLVLTVYIVGTLAEYCLKLAEKTHRVVIISRYALISFVAVFWLTTCVYGLVCFYPNWRLSNSGGGTLLQALIKAFLRGAVESFVVLVALVIGLIFEWRKVKRLRTKKLL